jgi:hypothetical protein
MARPTQPPAHARPRSPSRGRGRSGIRRGRIAAAAGALAVVIAVVLVVALSGGGSGKPQHPAATGTTVPKVAKDLCPLTGLPAPGGKVPQRPAVAVKVGNEPDGARPQSGLDEADIVYDTPAEGFIMRYIAVYQCQGAGSIGPTRSVRWVDWHILAQFGEPILAFAGGINPDVDTVESLPWLKAADLLTSAQQTGTRITSRVPPDNLYTSTTALWSLFPGDKTVPPAVFSYTAALPSGATPVGRLAIDFSPGTDVVWEWEPSAGAFLHTYSGVPDTDALTGQPVTATNVVVQIVRYTYGPYAESPGGTGDVESVTNGSGPGYVLRNGQVIKVTWHRASFETPLTFTDAAGQPVGLAAGRTWVELVPDTTASSPGALTITP